MIVVAWTAGYDKRQGATIMTFHRPTHDVLGFGVSCVRLVNELAHS